VNMYDKIILTSTAIISLLGLSFVVWSFIAAKNRHDAASSDSRLGLSGLLSDDDGDFEAHDEY